MASITGLEEIEVSVEGNGCRPGILHVDGNRAKVMNIDEEGTALSLVMLASNLPESLKEKVCYLLLAARHGKPSEPCRRVARNAE